MNEDLLIKTLLGEATPEESKAVSEWMARDEANRRQYRQLKAVWDTAAKLKAKSPLSEEEAWSRFQQRRENAATDRRLRFPVPGWIIGAVAAVLILAGVWSVWRLNSAAGMTEIHAGNTTREVTLPDGSTAVLHAGASLRYGDAFSTRRQVVLNGQAFFDVVHQPENTFSVTSGKVHITVIGTAFNVNPGSGGVEVVVSRGLVRVSRGKDTVRVARSQRITVNEAGGRLQVKPNHDLLYRFYADRTIVADNTPLGDLAVALSQAFKADVRIAGAAAADMRITATFKGRDLNGILDILQLTEPSLKIERTGSIIYLR